MSALPHKNKKSISIPTQNYIEYTIAFAS